MMESDSTNTSNANGMEGAPGELVNSGEHSTQSAGGVTPQPELPAKFIPASNHGFSPMMNSISWP